MIVTIIVPEALIAAARQFARCIGSSPADEETFRADPLRQTPGGLRCSVASGEMSDDFVVRARQPLILPPWGADMVLAGQAQAALDELLPGEDGSWPSLDPTRISFVLGYSGPVVMELLGLTWEQPPAP